VSSIAETFISLGMSARDAHSRAALFDKLHRAAPRILEGAPEWQRFTPGRIEIFGKHTDYAGGHSLLATVPRGIALTGRRRQDGLVRVGDIFDGQLIEVDPSQEAPPHYHGLQKYVHVVAHRFFLNFPGCELGSTLAIASDLPRASGLSSSSALVVGVALALIERAGLRQRDEWLRHLPDDHALAWYLGCVENGLDFPGLPGTAGVGTNGGSEDHTAIIASSPEHVSLYRFVPVKPIDRTRMPDDWMFVIASSGIQADKADSVRDRYNRASNGVRALHALWNRHASQPSPCLADAITSNAGAVDALRSWIAPTEDAVFSADDLHRRLDHFINETARAPFALEAFRRADREALGQLSDDSQREADTLLGNQIPQTILMAQLAREIGAFAASSFGAGFGGSVWAAVPVSNAEAFGREWAKEYARRRPDIGEVDWFLSRPGPAAVEVSLG
jgi:galactokinase